MRTRILDLLLIYSSLNFCCYGNLEEDCTDGPDEDYCNENFISAPAQISTPDSPTYIAAVVEYHPEYTTDSNETLKKNSDAYVEHIKTARVHNADIIVFPEDGLTTVKFPKREEMQNWTTIIPSASFNYTPCTDSTIEVSETLKKISCAARNNTIYVVINIAEKLPCIEDVCPKDKMFYYNSNVVFDRTGKIIARYRKTNLFGEQQFNVTSKPEIVIFDTDFGVKFGTFICFDILFHEPALQLTRVHQVTDIVYPTAWFSEAPFLTAVQTQAGWSFSEDVNFLVSGYNEPASGNTGSGIYLGREGIGKAIMSKTTRDEILVFEVPKKKKVFNKDHHDHSNDYDHKVYNHKKENIHEELWRKQFSNTMADNDTIFLIHDNINVFETFSLEGNVTRNVCKNNFCCDFKVEVVTIDPSKKYRLIAFSGIRLYATVEAGVRACGIVQCLNDSVSSCGSVHDSKTVFSRIEIDTTFYDYKNILIMPSTLRSDLLPLSENWTYNEHTHDDHVHISMLLNNNTNNLTTFGIYSRYFNKNNASRIVFDIYYFIALLVSLCLSRL
ncbi:vanin-like protein 2 isoform X1 [Formica exsecta]|uniref:vanin-like protein 2 isoform X1 n=1 Tax=Formica exsecta TaxID=72781 RepID=UPI001143FA74|nr:vanin-like protein 2 isoform X1 [Formica exsecta]XP_029667482.1 vanin-like protein 2 isoform X1 [Formica exsecta]XP_029667483.1 vanin-like protein 2 isoform X1 [Formica exsecta]XP_029667484.1 vanin-like protein 2 isoform X1 [Formica exsecta]